MMQLEFVKNDKSLVPKISLEQLAKYEKLSVRTINVCKNNGLNYLHDILNYYSKNGTFLKFKACGAKTEKELIELCLKYQDDIEPHNLYHLTKEDEDESNKEHSSIKKESELFQIDFNKFNKLQRLIANQYFKKRIKSLSKRTINCLSNIDIDNNIQTFYKIVSKSEFSIRKLKNVGKKTEREFHDFRQDICNLSNLLQSEADSQEFFRFFVSVVTKNLGVDEKFIENFATDFFETRFPLFRFIDFLIKDGYIYSDRELQIFYHRFNYCFDKKILTLEKLGEQLSTANQDKLTRERVRQLSLKINPILEGILSHLFICFPYTNYNISFQEDQDFIHINNDFSDRINMSENVNFTPKFYTKIFSIFIGDSHTLFPANLRDEENIYLIKKELFEYFDFNTFYQDIEKAVNGAIPETYSIHFEGYLYNFLKTEDLLILEKIFPICETIIFKDFDLFIDIDGSLTFEKNTKKIVEEYAIEVLNQCGHPIHLNDIYKNIEMKYPGEITNLRNLQSAIQRSNSFIFIGNFSVYGLKEWEDDKEKAIKGGTFKDIAEQFLEKFNEPKHISDINIYASKYRDTNEKQLLANLKSGNSSRFIFFYGGFVGLKEKRYQDLDIFLKSSHKPTNKKVAKKEDLLRNYYRLKTKLGRIPTATEMYTMSDYNRFDFYRSFGGWDKFLASINEIQNYTICNKISKENLIDAYYELKKCLGRIPVYREMDKFGKYSPSNYYNMFGGWGNFLESIGEATKRKSIHKEGLIAAYFDLKKKLAKSPTSTEMKKYGKYSLTAYDNKFGSWNKFLESIGETPRNQSISEKELFNAYFELKEKLGRIPTATEMNEFGRYGSSVYYSRFGGWKKFLKFIDQDDC